MQVYTNGLGETNWSDVVNKAIETAGGIVKTITLPANYQSRDQFGNVVTTSTAPINYSAADSNNRNSTLIGGQAGVSLGLPQAEGSLPTWLLIGGAVLLVVMMGKR
jgi:hypothetical protein